MSDNYLACISEQELERLGSQHEAWKPETHKFLRECGFEKLQDIVDFGCGPGFTAFDIATEINPASNVTAIDVSDYYLESIRERTAKARIQNIRTLRANATEDLEIADSFDGAFCRWFLAWVADDVDAVLRNVFRSLRRGGTFAAMEYLTLKSTVQSPVLPELGRYLNAWEDFYRETGGTTEIGASLPQKLLAAGFEITSMSCAGGYSPQGHRRFKWWSRLYQDFKGKFLEKGLLTEGEIKNLDEYFTVNGSNEHAFLHSAVLLQISAVKR